MEGLPSIFSRFLRGAQAGAASLGLALALFNELVHFMGLEVPCRSAVCGALARDPLNRFPPFTPGTLAALFFGIALVRSVRPTRFDRRWPALGIGTAAVAFAAQAYTRTKYGDFCPWCVAITGCVAVVACCALMLPAESRSAPRSLALGVLIGVGLAFGFVQRERSVGIDRLALSRLSTADVSPMASRVGDSRPGPVFLVDFSCSVCHDLMARHLDAGQPFAVRSAGRSDYDAAAARYLASFPTPEARTDGLRRLLAEPSGVAASIAHLPPPPWPFSGRNPGGRSSVLQVASDRGHADSRRSYFAPRSRSGVKMPMPPRPAEMRRTPSATS